jgi:replicative DNA helicase
MTLTNLNAYGPGFQVKVLSSLLGNKEFLINIHDILSEEYFDNQAHKWVVQEILKYYDKYHTTPTLDALKVELQKVENEVLQISIKEQLREAVQIQDTDSSYVEEEFATFCKNQQLKKALLSSVDLLKAGDYDSIKFMIENALKAGQDKNLGHEYEKDIEDRYRDEHRTTIPTPWPQFNEILQGGLGNGDFGLIFGNPGGGKSWSLVALGGHAVKMGYNVVHYTLELGEEYVGKRYDAFFTKISVSDINNHKDKIAEVLPDLPGRLIIKEFPTGKASISTIESHIKKVSDLGMTPDLIIIDYVDLLRSKKNAKERKEEIDDIYLSTKGLARELDTPIWSVSQVNRAGAQDDVIEGHKAAGSYDKMMVTDFAASLSRKKEDKVNGTGRWHIMKNRYGMDGLTFGAKADVSTGTFEIISEEELESIVPQQTQSYINEGSNNFSLEAKQSAAQFLNNI